MNLTCLCSCTHIGPKSFPRCQDVQLFPFNKASRSSYQGFWAYSWILGGSLPYPERGKYGLFTLASCSPRPRGTSRSFSLSSLLPSSRTGIRSPTASCRTDHPFAERNLPGWCQTAGSQGCLEESRLIGEPSNEEWDSSPFNMLLRSARTCFSPPSHSPSMQRSLSFHQPLALVLNTPTFYLYWRGNSRVRERAPRDGEFWLTELC